MENDLFLVRAKSVVKEFLHAYFFKTSVEQDDIMSSLKEDIVLFKYDKENGGKRNALLNLQMVIVNDWYKAYPISKDVCLVYGGFLSKSIIKSGKLLAENEKVRFNAICKAEETGIRICYIHQCIPKLLMEEERFFEKTQSDDGLPLNYEDLIKMSTIDSLTGVYNRGYMEYRIEGYLQKGHTNSMFIMVDLDDFKQINDTYGHVLGDDYLIQFSDVLTDSFKQFGSIGRIGGDEFCVFIEKVPSMDEARELIDKFYHVLSDKEITENKLKVGCTMGISFSNGKDMSFLTLYRNADIALYEAKRSGKGRYNIFNE